MPTLECSDTVIPGTTGVSLDYRGSGYNAKQKLTLRVDGGSTDFVFRATSAGAIAGSVWVGPDARLGLHRLDVFAWRKDGNYTTQLPLASKEYAVTKPPAPLSISGAAVTTGVTTADVSWTTSRPATTKVEYRVKGITTWSLGPQSSLLETPHAAKVSGLQSGRTYEFRLSSADVAGVSSSVIVTATTQIDVTPAPGRPTRLFDYDVTGGADASIAWEQFFINTPSGYDIHIKGGRMRLADRSFYLRNGIDKNVILDAPVELFATRIFPMNHEIVYIDGCSQVNLSGPGTSTGTHTNPGADFTTGQPTEFQAGVGVKGSNNVRVTGWKAQRNWGDGFGAYDRGGTPSSYIYFTDCQVEGNGRWAACITQAHHVYVERLRTKNLAGYMYEIESDADHSMNPYECYFTDGIHEGKGGMLFALAMYGGSHHIYVQRNQVKGLGNYGIWSQISEPKKDLVRNTDLWFEDNSGEAPFAEDGRGGDGLWTAQGVLLVAYADRVQVNRNTQPVRGGIAGIVENHATLVAKEDNLFPVV